MLGVAPRPKVFRFRVLFYCRTDTPGAWTVGITGGREVYPR